MKVLIIPGTITSKNDGDRHYISAVKLIELYGVRTDDNIEIYDSRFGFPHGEYYDFVLRPRYDGEYFNIHD